MICVSCKFDCNTTKQDIVPGEKRVDVIRAFERGGTQILYAHML
jgi:hypothetical protein